MTYQEIAKEVLRLPLQERLTLLAAISRSLSEELHPAPGGASTLGRLLGVASPGGTSVSDAELREGYGAYLAKKYG